MTKSRQESIELNERIRAQVLEQLKSGPKSFDALFAGCDVCEERNQLSSALFHLKSKDAIVQLDDRRYELGDKPGPAAPRKAETGKAPAPKATRRKASSATPPAAGNGNATARILEALLTDAQRALDEYIYSVGDKQILEQLATARDAAREALRLHQGNGQ